MDPQTITNVLLAANTALVLFILLSMQR